MKTIERWHLLIDEALVAEHKKAEATVKWLVIFGVPAFIAIFPAFGLIFSADRSESLGGLVATPISIILLTVSYWNYEVTPDEDPAKHARQKRLVIPVLVVLVAALLAWAAHLAFPRQGPAASRARAGDEPGASGALGATRPDRSPIVTSSRTSVAV